MAIPIRTKHAKSAWKSSAKPVVVKRPWGHEISWGAFNEVHGKILYIETGKRTSYKYNVQKNEVLYLLKGRAEITYGDEYSLTDPIGHPVVTEIFEEGHTLAVQSSCPYRIKALQECEIVEIGNNKSSAVVRIADDYGRTGTDE
jgi:mannose-6-phosphate isomerase-like protein (cupin superfamily)